MSTLKYKISDYRAAIAVVYTFSQSTPQVYPNHSLVVYIALILKYSTIILMTVFALNLGLPGTFLKSYKVNNIKFIFTDIIQEFLNFFIPSKLHVLYNNFYFLDRQAQYEAIMHEVLAMI